MQAAKWNTAFDEMVETQNSTPLERNRSVLKALQIDREEEAAAKARKCAANIEPIIIVNKQ